MKFELPSDAARVVAFALAEDLGIPADGLVSGMAGPEALERDVTSSATVDADAVFSGVIVARQGGVVCGLPLVGLVYETLTRAVGSEEGAEVFPLVAEGTAVEPGTAVAEIEGVARVVLTGERTALNLLMTLSGIATEAAAWQRDAGPDMQVLDTRKTLPGLRSLSKYAVRVGGAHNHRAGLFDMVLIKDNHLRHAGGVEAAIAAARAHAPGVRVEVEADTIDQATQATRAGADIVLLDNMDDSGLALAVAAVREAAGAAGRTVLIEASGGIGRDRLAALREIGIDRVSTSVLTLAPPLDFGLDEVNP